MGDVGAELRAKYGTPEWVASDRGENVRAWRHKSEESARAFAEANGEDGAAFYEDGHWYSTVDLTRKLADINARFRDGMTIEIYPAS